jgi:tetratricopeptide (TPR) repeat protein
MQYIIITLLSIVMSTFLIYLLTNQLLNIHLRIKPLVLCACCALLINLVLPRIIIGFTSIAATLIILVIFIFAFAYSIAYYNDKFSESKEIRNLLNQTSLNVQASASQQDKTAIENHNLGINNFISEDEEAFKKVEFQVGSEIAAISELFGSVETDVIATVEKIDVSKKERKEQICAIEDNNEKITSCNDKDATTLSLNSELLLSDTEVMTKTDIIGLGGPKVSKDNEITANLASKSTIEKVILSLESELVTSPTIFDEVDKRDEVLNEELQGQFSDIVEKDKLVQTQHELQLPIIMSSPTSNDLDSLMDLAFMYKEQRNFTQALTIFHQALALYPGSEVAPFLVMEIGNILKNNGQYNEAISVFCEARKLPGLQQNKTFESEFIKMIAYLRIVKNILLQHHRGFIPFNSIPDDVLKEIDAEFREWRNPM